MKINRRIRIKVMKRIINRLENYLIRTGPYGYTDTSKIFNDLMDWEIKLDHYESANRHERHGTE